MAMRVRIGIKMAVAVVFFAIIGIVITATFAFGFYRDAIQEQMINHGEQLSELIVSSMHENMLQNRQESLKLMISSFGVKHGVERVRLFNKKGEIRYSSLPGEISQSVELNDMTCTTCHITGKPKLASSYKKTRIFEDGDGKQYLSIYTAIPNEAKCSSSSCHQHPSKAKTLGLLDVKMPLSPIENRIREGRLRTAMFALVAMVAFSLITMLIVRLLILRPVERLVDATGRVAIGEWTDPIRGGRHDEMGDLIRAFNRMQERLQVSQRQLVLSGKLASVGMLAAGVAHEINNPLAGILTFSEDLYDSASPDDPLREDYEVIIRETMRCRDIVRELLDFARQKGSHMTRLDVNEVLRRTIQLVSRLAQFQNIEIVTDLQKRLPMIRGDIGQLQQVYLNLLINASEAMPNGGKVIVRTHWSKNDPLVETEITDTGVGMSGELKSRIFEPFFSTKERKTQGLGLSVSWGIIEEHGGTIDVKSVPGEGTAFFVSLPVFRQSTK